MLEIIPAKELQVLIFNHNFHLQVWHALCPFEVSLFVRSSRNIQKKWVSSESQVSSIIKAKCHQTQADFLPVHSLLPPHLILSLRIICVLNFHSTCSLVKFVFPSLAFYYSVVLSCSFCILAEMAKISSQGQLKCSSFISYFH